MKSNLSEEEKIPLRLEINRIVSILDKPENHKLKFDTRQLKKWIKEYRPELPEKHIDYIAFRVFYLIKNHKCKRENPKKYAEFLRKKREYNKMHPEVLKRGAKKRYERIKKDPILYQKMREAQKKYLQKKLEDPKYRKKMNEYQRKYLRELKEKDPEKYYFMYRIHKQVSRFIGGVRCPHCGSGIKTITAGKFGKRPIICPNCKYTCPKNLCEKIRIPRILPITSTEIKKHRREFDSMAISEKALEGLKNLEKLTSNNIDEGDYGKVRNMCNPEKIFENEKKYHGWEKEVVENIKKKMADY